MKINKKSLITAVTTAAILTAAPFGMNAKAEGNAPSKPTCDLGSKIKTFNNQEDAKTFMDNYIKDLESRFGVKVQLGQGHTPAQTEAPKKQQEQKPAEKTEAPKAVEKPVAKAPTQKQPATQQPAEKKTEQTASAVSAFEKKVVELTNAEREKQGLAPLELNEKLSKVAKEKSNDMKKNNYFSHNSPTYGSPFDMMKQFGVEYRTAGENIAMGQKSPEEVVNAWMNSEGHRANIMNGNFTQIGVGHVGEGNYWTQMFIGK